MLLNFLARRLRRLLFRFDLKGTPLQHQPERLIVMANHQSFFDGIMIQAHLPFDVTWVVHSQIGA